MTAELTYAQGIDGPILADLTTEPLGWIDFASCAESDPDLWHQEMGGTYTQAKVICGDCPVRAECLEYALDYEDDPRVAGSYGVFGGLDPRERDAIRRERRELPAAA